MKFFILLFFLIFKGSFSYSSNTTTGYFECKIKGVNLSFIQEGLHKEYKGFENDFRENDKLIIKYKHTNNIENPWHGPGLFDLYLKKTLSNPDKDIANFNKFYGGHKIVRGFDFIPNSETISGEGRSNIGVALNPNSNKQTYKRVRFNKLNFNEVTVKFNSKGENCSKANDHNCITEDFTELDGRAGLRIVFSEDYILARQPSRNIYLKRYHKDDWNGMYSSFSIRGSEDPINAYSFSFDCRHKINKLEKIRKKLINIRSQIDQNLIKSD